MNPFERFPRDRLDEMRRCCEARRCILTVVDEGDPEYVKIRVMPITKRLYDRHRWPSQRKP